MLNFLTIFEMYPRDPLFRFLNTPLKVYRYTLYLYTENITGQRRGDIAQPPPPLIIATGIPTQWTFVEILLYMIVW